MHTSSFTPDQALQMLVAGNRRYASGQAAHPHQSAERCLEVVSGQHPFAVFLGCADSRVPPEVFCDQGLGDLFVVRNAGHVVDQVVLGSLEYAVDHLDAPLVMVVGHTHCGAVTAAVQGGQVPGHISSIVDRIKPAVVASSRLAGNAILNAILEHVRLTVAAIKACEPILADAVKLGHLRVVGSLYHLDTGELELV